MSTSIIDSQEPAYREGHEINVLTRRIAELEREVERLRRAGYEIGYHDAMAAKGCEPDGWHECPKCGCVVGYTELHGGGWAIVMDDYQIPYNNCPQCGRPILVCDVEVER